MIEQGRHRARAVNAELGTTKNGNEQIGIEFELLDLPGQRIGYYGTFTERAMPITMKAMRTAGFRGNDILDLSSLQGNTPEVILVVEHEEYDGQWRAKVKWVNSLGGVSMRNALDPNAAKKFAARMRGEFMAHDMSEDGNAPPPSQMPQRAPQRSSAPVGQPQDRGRRMSDDDIPF